MKKLAFAASVTLVGALSLSACSLTLPGFTSQPNAAGLNFLKPETPQSQMSGEKSETPEASDSSKIKRIQLPVETFRRMPDLIGRAVEDAVEEITEHFSNAKLQITNEADLGKECGKGQKLVVVSQMPEKGSKVSNSPISNIKITTKCQIPDDSDDDEESDDDDDDESDDE